MSTEKLKDKIRLILNSANTIILSSQLANATIYSNIRKIIYIIRYNCDQSTLQV